MKKAGISCCLATALFTSSAFAFNSGSSGADSSFNPDRDTVRELPSDGVLNFTDVYIPPNVKVTFKKNTNNTPVIILASGDITIAGTLSVSGEDASGQTAGIGGPGGFDGGRGGSLLSPGGTGKGPGGGNGAVGISPSQGKGCSGGGGGYGDLGGAALNFYGCDTSGGAIYGSKVLVPLIGGSGGGGGAATADHIGYGGGGGGGAILLAASGKITITGTLDANGSKPGGINVPGYNFGGDGGGGSGGAIRLIATTIDGNGSISAKGADSFIMNGSGGISGAGGPGRISVETENLLRDQQSSPQFSRSPPHAVFAAALPMLRFLSVAGVAAPAQPTGSIDISLPAEIGNPVSVELVANGVPLGSSIKLISAPEFGAWSTATSAPLAGSLNDSHATAQINIADGKSTLIATVGFTVTAALGKELAPYANGETVARVELSTGLQGGGETKLITASGKEYLLPATAKAVLAQ